MGKQPTTTTQQSQRVVWLDTVRFFAMLILVWCHSADPFNFNAGEGQSLIDHTLWGSIWGSFCRVCVPLFVMVTGALLLPVKQDTENFYRKRIFRVLWPFLIWSVLYNLTPWLMAVCGGDKSTLQTFFPFGADTPMTLSQSLKSIAQIPLTFTSVACHMWYIYLLIGLYLYLPIFSAWVEKASDRAKLWFLVAWAVTLFLPHLRYFFFDNYVLGECSWNAFGMLYYFAGFTGYLLLGHYLRHHPIAPMRALLIGVPMFIVGFLITFIGFSKLRALPDCTPEVYELFNLFCSFHVAMMVIPMFWLGQHLPIKSERVQKLLRNVGICSFGIYMIHYFFIGPCYVVSNFLHVPLSIQVPVGGTLAFLVSWLVAYLLARLLGPAARTVLGIDFGTKK